MPSVEHAMQLFRERGDSEYGGEVVTQIQHALQCAWLAEQENAPSALVAAALLHDVGHLLHQLPDDAPESGIDDAHEELGYRYLQRFLGESVTEPVRLHVPAKRYLCATDPEYHGELSEPSLLSLELQGGPMSSEEIREFEANPFCQDAVRLRRWDDLAKDPDLVTPPLEHFANHVQNAAEEGAP